MLVLPVLAPVALGAAVVALPLPSRSVPPRQPTAAELQRSIDRLSVLGSVLYVAAHPDDENTRLLGWLANEKLMRTAYLAITRGDGGQNLIGSEQGPLLGLIRTQELLAARRIDGAEQLFTRALDFGYSKTPEETLSIWSKDDVLSDVIWAIRRFQPDVVITRFSTEAGETHGHHTASARLAGDAFRAAADPKVHPEQLAYVKPWAARRLIWNKAQFLAKPGEDFSGYLHTDTGGYNPALGLSYGELAADSRSMHKSQGFGAPRTRGEALEYFEVLDGDKPANGDFLGGIDFSWNRVPGSQKVQQALERAKKDFRVERPDASVPALLDAATALDALPNSEWKRYEQRALADVVAGCLGLTLDALAAEPTAVPGIALPVKVSALDRSATPAHWVDITVAGQKIAVGKPLSATQAVEVPVTVTAPEDAAPSSPYWLESPSKPGLFTVTRTDWIGLPENPPAFEVDAAIQVFGHVLHYTRPVLFQWVDPVAGQKTRAVEVTAPVLLKAAAPTLLFPDAKPRDLTVNLEAGAAHVTGSVHVDVPQGWRAEPASTPFTLEAKGDQTAVHFRITAPSGKTASTDALRVTADLGGKHYNRGITRIDHSHIPLQTLFPEATVKLVRFDLKRGRTHVGYIMGAGDDVPAALQQAGYDLTILDDAHLRDDALTGYDAIVIGVRAFNTKPQLTAAHQKLMDWVAGGGTLVVQYNTNNRLATITQPIGPFPFQISQDRVTDETAAVTFTDPANPLLSTPNALTPADFEGWVQERGLYFANQWDPKYATPLSMHDPNEPARLGSLLVAKHGKGTFIYTGLAFFRQLPAGVPGAFRLFANLLAHGSR